MFPILLRLGPYPLFGHEIGPLVLHTYGLMVALGFLAAILVVTRGAKRSGLPAEPVIDVAFVAVVAAIVGSRLLYVMLNFQEFSGAPLRALRVWEGGLVFHGGLLLAIPACWVAIRRAGLPTWATADVFAPATALGQAIGRIGCFSAGCCYGCETDSPFAVVFTHPESLAPLNTPLAPTQLIAAVSGAVVFGILLAYAPRRRAAGQVFWLYLVLASAARVVEDAFRGGAAKTEMLPWLSATQAISIALALAGLALMIAFGRRAASRP